jgi:hypothetical protein
LAPHKADWCERPGVNAGIDPNIALALALAAGASVSEPVPKCR